MIRALLISNSGRPFLHHALQEIDGFLGAVRCIGYITAARIDDAVKRYEMAAASLHGIGVAVEHLSLDADLPGRLQKAEAVFIGGGNTYALLKRLRESGILARLEERVRLGMPYIGASAGSNIAGKNILCTNDWNVVGAVEFDGMGLVPWTLNPHYLEADPAMAATSETRDERIREYLAFNDNPVVGIEESTAIRVEGGIARVVGTGRAKLFQRGVAPRWIAAGEGLPLEMQTTLE